MNEKIFNEGNQIHKFMSSSGSDFLTSYGSGSGSTSQKVTVPTVLVPVPQHWLFAVSWTDALAMSWSDEVDSELDQFFYYELD